MVARRLAHLAHRSLLAALAPWYRLALVLLLALLALAPQLGHASTAQAATLSFTVNSTADTHDATPGDGLCADSTGLCTLRAAVEEADAQPSGSVITIAIPADTYLLSLGTLTLSRNTITLAGAGASTTTLDGQGHRILVVAVTAFVKIGGLSLTNGNAGSSVGGALANLGLTILSHSTLVSDTSKGGGGIYNGPAAQLALLNSTVISDTAPQGGGGGIFNDGALTVVGSSLSANSAALGGGIYNSISGTLTVTTSSVMSNTATFLFIHGGEYGGQAAGLYNLGSLSVSSSTVSGNSAPAGPGGIYNNGPLTVVSSTVSDNAGGGIMNFWTRPAVTVMSSILSGNSPNGGIFNDGALILTGSTLSGNSSPGYGGGIANNGTLTVTASLLSGNSAPASGSGNAEGGGIFNANGGTLTLINSTLSGNSASVLLGTAEGGGIYNGNDSTATVTGSTFSGNSAFRNDPSGAAFGGGIYNDSRGRLSMTDSTIAGNTAPSGGGGLYTGGITVALSYVTIAGNASGIENNSYAGGGETIALTGTIVANSTSGPNCSGPGRIDANNAGYNLDSGTSCGFTQPTDLSNTNPLLGPLQNNGGPTPTMALQPGSPAIDHGGTAASGCPATDQRGLPRPDAGETQCDMGAYESQGVG